MIDVAWVQEEQASYKADVEVDANDRPNLLTDISTALNVVKAKLIGVNARTNNDRTATIDITLETQGLDDLNNVIKALRKIDSVYDVKRKKI